MIRAEWAVTTRDVRLTEADGLKYEVS
jgi:hypothetical protein